MQLSQIDISATDTGTTPSFVDSSGNPIDSTAQSMVVPADTSTMDAASVQAAQSSTDSLGNLDITKLISSLSSSYVSVQNAINAGTAPPYTAVHPTPGMVRVLPGGVRTVVNADGSTTITDATGKSQTVLANGTVVAGGAPLIPGISNTTLMIAGGALLLAALFLRKPR